MAKTEVDIDTLIGKDILEITLGGRKYVVKDIPISTFLGTVSETIKPEDLKAKLATMMSVPEAELGDIGFRTMLCAINRIREWMMKQDFLGGSAQGNP